jgi:thioredoxin-related protein
MVVKNRFPILLFLIASAWGIGGFAPVEPEPKVKWLTFEEAAALMEKNPKKIFIDVYTDWCGWCKVMDKNTFSDEKIAKYLNENFYPVKLNAEQREDIVFRGHTFKFVANGSRGYHELAAALLNGKLSYPSVVYLDENFQIIMPVPGYNPPQEFEKQMTFVGEDHFKTIRWDDYSKNYK